MEKDGVPFVAACNGFGGWRGVGNAWSGIWGKRTRSTV